MKTFWDDRYRAAEYVYGEVPNVFFASILQTLPPGRLLLPAEGEGRNGVFAATLGWEVYAFDQSEEGRRKAMALAASNQVNMQYDITDVQQAAYPEATFDVIALIYTHFPPDIRTAFHAQVIRWLKPGGLLIVEGFTKEHLSYNQRNPSVGGPREEQLLYSAEELRNDFSMLEQLYGEEMEVELNEGAGHRGLGKVIRLLAKKP